MNIKLLRKQIAKGEYELVEVDVDDEAAVEALKLHNKKVNHKIYEEKKIMSQYSVEQIEAQVGHEFSDDGFGASSAPYPPRALVYLRPDG